MVRIQRKRLDLNLKHADLLRIDTCIKYNSTFVKKISLRQLNEFPLFTALSGRLTKLDSDHNQVKTNHFVVKKKKLRCVPLNR